MTFGRQSSWPTKRRRPSARQGWSEIRPRALSSQALPSGACFGRPHDRMASPSSATQLGPRARHWLGLQRVARPWPPPIQPPPLALRSYQRRRGRRASSYSAAQQLGWSSIVARNNISTRFYDGDFSSEETKLSRGERKILIAWLYCTFYLLCGPLLLARGSNLCVYVAFSLWKTDSQLKVP
jgi:hypothetical protein